MTEGTPSASAEPAAFSGPVKKENEGASVAAVEAASEELSRSCANSALGSDDVESKPVMTQQVPSVSQTTASASDASVDDRVAVDEQVLSQTRAAVEAYFSDEHVAKDAFMYKHIQRGKEGFVNIKLVSSFRRVKSITKDWHVVQEAVRRSTKLRLNDEGTKVGRIAPLPEHIHPVTRAVDDASRTILAYRIVDRAINMSTVEKLFEKCGRITKIVIYREGDDVPNELRQQLYKMHLLTQGEIVGLSPMAVVQFATQEEALRAVALSYSSQKHFNVRIVPPVSAKKAARLKAAMAGSPTSAPEKPVMPIFLPALPMLPWSTPPPPQSPLMSPSPPPSAGMWSRGLDLALSPPPLPQGFMQQPWRSPLQGPPFLTHPPQRNFPNENLLHSANCNLQRQFFCQPDSSGCMYFYADDATGGQQFQSPARRSPGTNKLSTKPGKNWVAKSRATPETTPEKASPESRRPHGPSANGQRGFVRSPKPKGEQHEQKLSTVSKQLYC